MPPPPDTRRWLHRFTWWFIALAIFVAALSLGFTELNRRMRIEQAQRELAQLQRMIEQFKVRHGQYPVVFDSAPLLRCLLGRADEKGRELASPQPWFVTGAQLYFLRSDPTEPGNMIVDPWGTPYLYFYLFPIGPDPEGFMLVSAGPDRRHSQTLAWPTGRNGTQPEDADNLWVSTRVTDAGKP